LAATDKLYSKYKDFAQFLIIYTIDAHPTGSISPYSSKEWTAAFSNDKAGLPVYQPQSYEKRVALAEKMIEESGIRVPVLVDEFDNPVWFTYGPAPNIAYLIDRDGTVILRQPWYDAVKMEEAILKLKVR
jgi:hypothetical protein